MNKNQIKNLIALLNSKNSKGLENLDNFQIKGGKKMLDGYKTYIVGIEDKITTLESELCKKDNTYNWC